MIARQRFSLNRTQRVAKGLEPAEAVAIDRLIGSEKYLAAMARLLAEGFESRGSDKMVDLYRAEAAMLAAAESLEAAAYEPSTGQQREALNSLIAAREAVRIAFLKGDDGGGGCRQLDRQLAQKFRRPTDQDQLAREVPGRLRQLAGQEESISSEMSAMSAAAQIADGSTDRRDALYDRQRDVVDEARDVEDVMGRIQNLSELAISRMAAAAARAEDAEGALARGSAREAADAARHAAPMFAELARHTAALIEQEAAHRIARSRDLSSDMARRQRELEAQLDQAGAAGGTQGDIAKSGGGPGAGELLDQARGLAESGRTLDDVLSVVALSQSEDDSQAVTELAQLLREADLADALRRLQQQSELLQAERPGEAKVAGRAVADQLDMLSQRLDALYRQVVAPRLQELAELQQRAAELREQLGTLDSEISISEWHQAADALLAELGRLPAGNGAADALQSALGAAGWGSDNRGWHWHRVGAFYASPEGYVPALDGIIGELQDQMQEILLRDMVASGDEAMPLEYRSMVERYYRVLSGDLRQ